jgi:FdhD protein
VLQPEARELPAMEGAPRVSSALAGLLRRIEILDERGVRRPIYLPVERALTLQVDGCELVTLMTLGAWPEMLVLGYLFNQRLITTASTLESIAVAWEPGVAEVVTRTGADGIAAGVARRLVTSGCGQGTVLVDLIGDIDLISLPSAADARLKQSTLLRLLETVRTRQSIHHAAGSVHSCALFCDANLLLTVEDVGRHNAVDTICGWMLMHGVSGHDKILFTTGRLTSEMVVKAAHCGVPIVVSRNGTSAMGYDLACRFGMTLIGRAANRRFLCYTGADRFDADSAPPPSAPARAID